MKSSTGAIVLIVLVAIVAMFIFLSYKTGRKYRKDIFGTRKISGMSPELPLDGNLYAAYRVLHFSDRFTYDDPYVQLTAAQLLKWSLEGKCSFDANGGPDGTGALIFGRKYKFVDKDEAEMFARFCSVAHDSVLTPGLAAHWARRHYKGELQNEYLGGLGKFYLLSEDFIRKEKTLSLVLTTEGAGQARKLIEFRNYIQAAIAARTLPAAAPKEDCLIYAILFKLQDAFLDTFKAEIPSGLHASARLCLKISEALWNAYDEAADKLRDVD